jgi:probable HAF family extracellular repeat protein
VSPSGQVVGWSDTAAGFSHAFSWTRAGGLIDLGTLGGPFSLADAVNARGQVVGYASLSDGLAYHAFSWTQAGGMVDLGTLGGNFSDAAAVNARGDVVGDSSTAAGETHATLWRT